MAASIEQHLAVSAHLTYYRRVNQTDFNLLHAECCELWEDFGMDEWARSSLTAEVSAPPKSLDAVRAALGDCKNCELCEGRKSIVFGEGNPKAKIVFVGESPGVEEDLQGKPFVDAGGRLLTKMIEAMGFTREEVYITGLVKCKVPSGRAPEEAQLNQCSSFLQAQINSIQPSFIVALGETAAHSLTGLKSPLEKVRGKFHPLPWNKKIAVLATYPPAHLLENPEAKKAAWEDLKLVMKQLKQ